MLLSAACLLVPAVAVAWTQADFVAAADQGQCIEDLVYQQIRSAPSGGAADLIKAAVEALGERTQQQLQLGCEGDIAAQAITAGADPVVVLEATAASL